MCVSDSPGAWPLQGSAPVFNHGRWVGAGSSVQTPMTAAIKAGHKELARLLAHGTEVTDAVLLRLCMRDTLAKSVPFLLQNGACSVRLTSVGV